MASTSNVYIARDLKGVSFGGAAVAEDGTSLVLRFGRRALVVRDANLLDEWRSAQLFERISDANEGIRASLDACTIEDVAL